MCTSSSKGYLLAAKPLSLRLEFFHLICVAFASFYSCVLFTSCESDWIDKGVFFIQEMVYIVV